VFEYHAPMPGRSASSDGATLHREQRGWRS
jgi:hypothetical protein